MSETKPRSRPLLALPAVIIPAALALAEVGYFFILNRTELGLGFPIDDAYIFKRYAENLAAGAGFSFNPGEVTLGCTSLLWTIVMSALLRPLHFMDYITICCWVGGNLFALAALLAAVAVLRRTRSSAFALLAGLLVAGSVPLLMNAVSGMETILTLALLTAFAVVVLADSPRPLLAGVIAGMLGITRPEGLYFIAGTILAGAIVSAFRAKGLGGRALLQFIIPPLIITAPAYAVVYKYTGSFLPATYLAKIVSVNPATLDRTFSNRAGLAVFSLADGWARLAEPLRALALIIALGIVAEVVLTVVRLIRRQGPAWPLLGRLVLAGYLLLPLAYGFFFPVGPAFGGYYNRYIAPVLAAAAILGALGLHSLSRPLRRPASGRAPSAFFTAFIAWSACLVLIGYLAWLDSFEFPEAIKVFRAEVKLNTGLRMDAARWLASPDNVPPDARVMTGYCGLGVIGGACNHYVLDLGALINPDILPYYREPAPDPATRWAHQVAYMHDRNVAFYVTFALTADYAQKIADPAGTPGFVEAARLGSIASVPDTSSEQVRIYHVDWDKWQAAKLPPEEPASPEHDEELPAPPIPAPGTTSELEPLPAPTPTHAPPRPAHGSTAAPSPPPRPPAAPPSPAPGTTAAPSPAPEPPPAPPIVPPPMPEPPPAPTSPPPAPLPADTAAKRVPVP
jgi:hypothetical protein